MLFPEGAVEELDQPERGTLVEAEPEHQVRVCGLQRAAAEHRLLKDGERRLDMVGVPADRMSELGAVEHRQVRAFAGCSARVAEVDAGDPLGGAVQLDIGVNNAPRLTMRDDALARRQREHGTPADRVAAFRCRVSTSCRVVSMKAVPT